MDEKQHATHDLQPSFASNQSAADLAARKFARCPYMQNRELSWLTFDERVLELGADETVPLLERLQFISIFSSNLQEFFMVRVGSLTDLNLLKKEIIDTKSNMTPAEQLNAIYERVHELYPVQETIYHEVQELLAHEGIRRLTFEELNEEQRAYAQDYLHANVSPFLMPQIINARHPFPHLENSELYIIVRLTENTPKKSELTEAERKALKEARRKEKNLGAEGVMLGVVPLPKNAQRVIKLPGEGFNFILLEDLLEANVAQIYSMYTVKHTNIICVTRNADLDATETADEGEEDYREHMKKILKKRARLAPVRLEAKRKLSSTVSKFLLSRLELSDHQVFITGVPMNLGYAFALPSMVEPTLRARLTSEPFIPAWPASLSRHRRITDQIQERDVMLSYPYESMEPFVQLLREAATDPEVVSIKITLYRLASQSHLAEALIAAAEAGKEVTALFELRARFDESNNIQWSQRFEEAGANVIYGFHDFKVHSKICCITRQTAQGLQYITQLGTGNYNEKTAKLYTDFSFITTDEAIGRDAMEFFRNMGLENASRSYQTLWVAPLQIKQNILRGIDEQIALAKENAPCGLFFKTNSVTDREVIEKIAEASQAGVPVTLLVRGISCLVPQVPNETEHVRVVSIVGRLLEHSRIYAFGPLKEATIYLSSADLMTRNMDKRIEIAWPLREERIRDQVISYIETCMSDTAKLRELRTDGTYTPLRATPSSDGTYFNAQEYLIAETTRASEEALSHHTSEKTAFERLSMQAKEARATERQQLEVLRDLEDVYREALQHEIGGTDNEVMASFVKAAARAFASVEVSSLVNARHGAAFVHGSGLEEQTPSQDITDTEPESDQEQTLPENLLNDESDLEDNNALSESHSNEIDANATMRDAPTSKAPSLKTSISDPTSLERTYASVSSTSTPLPASRKRVQASDPINVHPTSNTPEQHELSLPRIEVKPRKRSFFAWLFRRK